VYRPGLSESWRTTDLITPAASIRIGAPPSTVIGFIADPAILEKRELSEEERELMDFKDPQIERAIEVIESQKR
jgi:hypothetical protein